MYKERGVTNWAKWLAAVALIGSGAMAQAQGPGFTPPPPTPLGSPFGPPTPGDPVPLGPSKSAHGSEQGGAVPAGGPGIAPPASMLTLLNNPNAFDDDIMADSVSWSCYSSFSVDLLFLTTRFDRNPAFRTDQRAPGSGVFFTQDFTYTDTEVTPRLTFDLRVGDWGVRASWMKTQQESNVENTTNSNFRATVLSPPLVDGSIRVSEKDQIIVGNVFLKNVNNQFTQRTAAQVSSPRAYFFVNLVPRATLLPPNQGSPIPPFTLANALQAGFPDFLKFSSTVTTEIYDMEITRAIEFNRATGLVGLGARYGYVSNGYFAQRRNANGSTVIPGYDPFISLVFDAVINSNQDRETVTYGHNFGGVGPKLSFEIGTEVTHWARLYAKANGSVLMGCRKETAYYEALQAVNVTDVNLQGGQQQSDLFYTRTVSPQVAASRNTFTVIPLTEVEAGVECAMGVGGKIFPVVRAGFFGQCWFNGGNATNPNANLFIYGFNASFGIGF